MGNPALAPDERYTYRQYRTWPDEERWELIEGQPWLMSPAPLRRHQTILTRLFGPLSVLLEGKDCQVFVAPFDVLLPRGDEVEDEVDSVVQPDLVVYCDRAKLTERGARGAPDLAMEILSPSTSKKDLSDKFALYEKRGVREYWVVDPAGKWLQVYRLGKDPRGTCRFDAGELREPFRDYSPIASRVVKGFSVDPAPLFADLD